MLRQTVSPVLRRKECSRPFPKTVSCLAFDFDGVMTDNRVYVGANGEEFVRCDRGDGFGIEKLRSLGIPMVVLSKETNPVVSARCQKLNIPCMQNISDKSSAFENWLAQNNLVREGTIFVGNDENDVAVMRWASFACAPNDAHESAIDVADLVLTKSGGRGAVRELCDRVALHYRHVGGAAAEATAQEAAQ